MRILLTLFLTACFLPSIAIAQSARSYALTFDVPTKEDFEDGSTFKIVGKANTTYQCGVNLGEGFESNISTNVLAPNGDTITGTRTSEERAERNIQLAFGGTDDATKRDNLVFFNTNDVGTYTFTLGAASEMQPLRVSVYCLAISIRCDFNTVANEFNFMEVTNLGDHDLVASVTTVGVDGSVNSIAPATFPAGQRIDVDLHSLAGPNTFGSAYLQPLNSYPFFDGIPSPKISTYQNGELTSSLPCYNQPRFAF